ALQAEGLRAIMVNSNPETVSTDFDTSSRLYFEPLDEESVRNIVENEEGPLPPTPSPARGGGVPDSPPLVGEGPGERFVSPPPGLGEAGTRRSGCGERAAPVITQFGGQTAINLAAPLQRAGCTLIGSGVEAIDLAE